MLETSAWCYSWRIGGSEQPRAPHSPACPTPANSALPRGVQEGPCGSIWVRVGPYGSVWVHMGPYESLWVCVGPGGSLWVRVGPYESMWVLVGLCGSMGPYGSHLGLCGSMDPFGSMRVQVVRVDLC